MARTFLDVPACPACGEPLGVWASYKARLDRHACERCGTPLKIHSLKHFGALLGFVLLLRYVDDAYPWPRNIIIILGILLVGGALEYLIARPVKSGRTSR